VILDKDAVVKDSDVGRAGKFAVFELGSMEDDVVGLPLSWLAAGINERGILTIDGAGHSVGIGWVLIGIENLNFVEAHQKDAAVAASLVFALNQFGGGPFDMELAGAEGLFGLNVAGAREDFDIAVFEFPGGGLVGLLGTLPGG
jgi:hypothetical protein